MNKPKKKRCDSVAGITEIAKNLQTKIESPIKLSDDENQIFDRIIESIPSDCWDVWRIELATTLAQLMVTSRHYKKQVEQEGITIESPQGGIKMNPAHTAYVQCVAQMTSITRTLGLSASKQGVDPRELGKRKEAESTVRDLMNKVKDNSLLA